MADSICPVDAPALNVGPQPRGFVEGRDYSITTDVKSYDDGRGNKYMRRVNVLKFFASGREVEIKQ